MMTFFAILRSLDYDFIDEICGCIIYCIFQVSCLFRCNLFLNERHIISVTKFMYVFVIMYWESGQSELLISGITLFLSL